MKKSISFITAAVMALSALTSCGSSGSGGGKDGGGESDKSGYKQALNGFIDAFCDKDLEEAYSYAYPKELVEAVKNAGYLDYEDDEDDSETSMKVKSLDEGDALTDAQLKMAEIALAQKKLYLEMSEDDDFDYDKYDEEKEDVEPFCEVTKGYAITAEVEITYTYTDDDDDDDDYDDDDDESSKKGGKSSKGNKKTETESEELSTYAYYVKDEGWKIDIRDIIGDYLTEHSVAGGINSAAVKYIEDLDLDYTTENFIISNNEDYCYNVPSSVDVDKFIEELEDAADGYDYFVVCSYYNARFTACAPSGKTKIDSVAPYGNEYLTYDEDDEWYDWETLDDDLKLDDLFGYAKDAVESYNSDNSY